MHCQGWALRRRVCSDKPGRRFPGHGRAQVSGRGLTLRWQHQSTCNEKTEMCIAFGLGTAGDMHESTNIIATKQFEKAMELYNSATEEVTGPEDFRHSFVEMAGLHVTLYDGSTVTTCTVALCASFASGTTDGPGMFDFTQGETSLNPFWVTVSDVLSVPTQEQVDCHAPKAIRVGGSQHTASGLPYWQPRHSEHAERDDHRERATVAISEIFQNAGENVQVTIGGLANSYSYYCAMYEESHALDARIQEFSGLSKDLSRVVEPAVPSKARLTSSLCRSP